MNVADKTTEKQTTLQKKCAAYSDTAYSNNWRDLTCNQEKFKTNYSNSRIQVEFALEKLGGKNCQFYLAHKLKGLGHYFNGTKSRKQAPERKELKTDTRNCIM